MQSNNYHVGKYTLKGKTYYLIVKPIAPNAMTHDGVILTLEELVSGCSRIHQVLGAEFRIYNGLDEQVTVSLAGQFHTVGISSLSSREFDMITKEIPYPHSLCETTTLS